MKLVAITIIIITLLSVGVFALNEILIDTAGNHCLETQNNGVCSNEQLQYNPFSNQEPVCIANQEELNKNEIS